DFVPRPRIVVERRERLLLSGSTDAFDGVVVPVMPQACGFEERVGHPATRTWVRAQVASSIPLSGFFRRLSDAFGWRLLVVLHFTIHWPKGYCYLMVNSVVRFYLQDMNVPGPLMDRYMSIVFMPFALKPWVGLLSDCFPLFGYGRMPYLVGAGAIGIAGTLLAILIVPSST
ncbi:hypothetical protein FOZ63_013193, partial [Perkinsus olseni]